MSNIKGNKSDILSTEEKELMVSDYQNGFAFRELSKKYNISHSVSRKICLKFDEHGKSSFIQKREKNNKIRILGKDPRDIEIARLRKIEKEHEVLKKFIEWAEKQN